MAAPVGAAFTSGRDGVELLGPAAALGAAVPRALVSGAFVAAALLAGFAASATSLALAFALDSAVVSAGVAATALSSGVGAGAGLAVVATSAETGSLKVGGFGCGSAWGAVVGAAGGAASCAIAGDKAMTAAIAAKAGRTIWMLLCIARCQRRDVPKSRRRAGSFRRTVGEHAMG